MLFLQGNFPQKSQLPINFLHKLIIKAETSPFNPGFL
jgi:hypothetical protein